MLHHFSFAIVCFVLQYFCKTRFAIIRIEKRSLSEMMRSIAHDEKRHQRFHR